MTNKDEFYQCTIELRIIDEEQPFDVLGKVQHKVVLLRKKEVRDLIKKGGFLIDALLMGEDCL